MPNLEVLYLQENEISRVEPMRGLPSLRLVNLSFNHLTDLSELRNFLPLPNLAELYLNGNALETDPRHIFNSHNGLLSLCRTILLIKGFLTYHSLCTQEHAFNAGLGHT